MVFTLGREDLWVLDQVKANMPCFFAIAILSKGAFSYLSPGPHEFLFFPEI